MEVYWRESAALVVSHCEAQAVWGHARLSSRRIVLLTATLLRRQTLESLDSVGATTLHVHFSRLTLYGMAVCGLRLIWT